MANAVPQDPVPNTAALVTSSPYAVVAATDRHSRLPALLGSYGRAGGVSPRSSASYRVTAALRADVASRSSAAVRGRPSYCDRSAGGPASTRNVLRGNGRGFVDPYGSSSWAPQCATGMT